MNGVGDGGLEVKMEEKDENGGEDIMDDDGLFDSAFAALMDPDGREFGENMGWMNNV